MRWSPLVLLALLIPQGGASEEGCPVCPEKVVEARTDTSTSNSGVTVVSPSLGWKITWGNRTSVSARYTLDAVTAASWNYKEAKTHRTYSRDCATCHNPKVDGFTGASTRFSEPRSAITLGASHRLADTTVGVNYDYSGERDYRSNTLGFTVAQDLFNRNTTLSFGYRALGDSSVPALSTDAPRRYLNTAVYDFALGQVVSARTQARATFRYGDARGYLANQYSYIGVGTIPYAEVHPDSRVQRTWSVLFNQYLPWNAGVEPAYQYYSDTWGVRSHTASLGYHQQVGEGLIVSPEYRYSTQTGAFFFKDRFTAVEPFMSRDLWLAPFSSHTLGVGIRYAPRGRASYELRYSRYLQSSSVDYTGYYQDGDTRAHLIQAGVILR